MLKVIASLCPFLSVSGHKADGYFVPEAACRDFRNPSFNLREAAAHGAGVTLYRVLLLCMMLADRVDDGCGPIGAIAKYLTKTKAGVDRRAQRGRFE